MIELAPFITLGLLGSLHCVGMCGGFAIIAGSLSRGRSRMSALGHGLAYAGGKALVYGILGLLAHLGFLLLTESELMGAEISHAGHDVASVRQVATWITGGALILLGLGHLGLRLPRVVGAFRLVARWRAMLGFAWSGIRSLPGATGSFAVGLVTGMLPCGLSWSAVLLAAPSSHATAFAGPFLFGLATAPALLLSASAGRAFRNGASRWSLRLIGPALVLLGLLTLARGGMPGMEAVAPDCCAPIGGGLASEGPN